MNIERKDFGAVTVLRMQGDLDETGVDALRTSLYECMEDSRYRLVLNLGEVRFISYMGVGVLVERLRKVRASNGDMKLVSTNLYTERLFRMLGVTSLFDSYDSETHAIGVFQAAA